MKKELFLLATAATLFAACTNTEDFRDVSYLQNAENDGSIDFTSFIDKTVMTKAENSSALYTQSFKSHHDDFAVWGFKTGTKNAGQVFGSALVDGTPKTSTTGTTVTVGGTVAAPTYTYSPLRFWDKSASGYYFFAVAPAKIANAAWATFNEGATPNTTGYFTAAGVTLTGANLRDLATATTYATGAPGALQNNFKGSGDVDRLIAAPCEVTPNRYSVNNPDKVHLNFIHILSKLNISIRKNTTTLPTSSEADQPNYTVTLTEFGIYNMPIKGDFNENTAASQSGSNDRWDVSSYNGYSDKTVVYKALDKNATKTLTVTGDDQYIIESLVIPQDINYERVALDGGHHDLEAAITETYYETYAEYTAAKPYETPELTEAEFDAIKGKITGNTATPEDKAKVTKTAAKPAVAAYDAVGNTEDHSSEPYFKITYTINNGENTETFTYYYNLVAAFKNYDNDGHQSDGTTAIAAGEDKIAFNEGWQNTLHIIINPNAIQFTADVAEWADAYSTIPEFVIK